MNEISLLFNHHSDVRKTQEKYRGRAMSTFSVFSLDILSKMKDNASADPMTDPGGGGYFEKIMNVLGNTVMIRPLPQLH